ncbi:MAG TPA: Gfo/Idh/MocA family oxidoreductase [Planctomycetota bacterium]|nr:Gfo/Idh/MocA family oxidoreductase [Planctomycetota bacterium]
MEDLKGGLIGCGYFAQNHLHAWRQVKGASLAAVCDSDLARARTAAASFGVERSYADAGEMLRAERLDFVDIVTQPASHRELVELAAHRGVHVICQKPVAFELEDARVMVEACSAAGVRFMVHENFRWQAPMRAVKAASARLGSLFFGRVSFRTAFDVYASQPYLALEPRLIVLDLGVHLLDLARFFFGEARSLNCVLRRVNPGIRGEDSATILLEAEGGAACVVDMSFSSRLEEEIFPQTLVQLEGELGSVSLGPHYQLSVTTAGGVERRVAGPRRLEWAAPGREAIQESVLSIQEHWVRCLREECEPETSGRDNLRTMDLVHGAYASAASGLPHRAARG